MKHPLHHKGFTLVEMAIVLVVLGLLVGGILKGLQLITNARMTAIIVDVTGVETAVTTFKDTYQHYPGDFPTANSQIPNCSLCGLVGAMAGDGYVGPTNWGMSGPFQSNSFVAVATPPGNSDFVNMVPPNSNAKETILFWVELSKAGYLGGMGITDDGIMGNPISFGSGLPAARGGAGGYVVGTASPASATMPGRPGTVPPDMSGLTLMILRSSSTLWVSRTAPGDQMFTPSEADQIDRKMDDSRPGSGTVQAYGVMSSCYSTTVGTATDPAYDGSIGTRDCGLYFRINQ
jgi:prepilin-type N-terminal cleavage/methylation domain-containing protein